MNFASDNWSGAAAPVNAALSRHNDGFVPAYGGSEFDESVRQRISEVFGRDCSVLFVPTGTAANSLAAALCAKPGGIVLAHADAHVIEDECGGPEFAMGGGRIEPVGGPLGKIAADALEAALKRHDPPFLHHGRPVMLTLTQATEAGTVYTLEEIETRAKRAKDAGLGVHMDGARFANALAHLDCSAAQMTWRAGVDLLSLGATKNGCWCAEALVIFDRSLQEEAEYLRKRSGWLFSKSRFVTAQFDAWLKDGLWLELARHANAMADRLRTGIEAAPNARLAWPGQANEVFVLIEAGLAGRLQEKGARFYPWAPPHGYEMPEAEGVVLYRFVTSFATTEQEVDAFCTLLGKV